MNIFEIFGFSAKITLNNFKVIGMNKVHRLIVHKIDSMFKKEVQKIIRENIKDLKIKLDIEKMAKDVADAIEIDHNISLSALEGNKNIEKVFTDYDRVKDFVRVAYKRYPRGRELASNVKKQYYHYCAYMGIQPKLGRNMIYQYFRSITECSDRRLESNKLYFTGVKFDPNWQTNIENEL